MASDPVDDFLAAAGGAADEEDDPLVSGFLAAATGRPKVDPAGPPPAPPEMVGDWDPVGIMKELPGAVVETVKSLPERGVGYLTGVVDLPTYPLRQLSEEVSAAGGMRPEGAGSVLNDFYRAFGVAPELTTGAGATPFGEQLVGTLGLTEGAYAADEWTLGRTLAMAVPGMWGLPQNVRDSLTRGAAQLVGGILEDPTAVSGLLSGKVVVKASLAKLNDLVQVGLGVAALPGLGIGGLEAFGRAKDALVAGNYPLATQYALEGVGSLGLAGLITKGIRDGQQAKSRSGKTEVPAEPALPPGEIPPPGPVGITQGEVIARELPPARPLELTPRTAEEVAEAVAGGMDAEMLGLTTSPLDLARAVLADGPPEATGAFRQMMDATAADAAIRDIPEIQRADQKTLLDAMSERAKAAEEKVAEPPAAPEPIVDFPLGDADYAGDVVKSIDVTMQQHEAAGGAIETSPLGVRVAEVGDRTLLSRGTAGMIVYEGKVQDFGNTAVGTLRAADALLLGAEALRRGFAMSHVLSPDSLALMNKVADLAGMSVDELRAAAPERILSAPGVARVVGILEERYGSGRGPEAAVAPGAPAGAAGGADLVGGGGAGEGAGGPVLGRAGELQAGGGLDRGAGAEPGAGLGEPPAGPAGIGAADGPPAGPAELAAVTPAPTAPSRPTPDRTALVGRGAHGQVRVVFPDAAHKDLYSAIGRMRAASSGSSPGRRGPDFAGLAQQLGLPTAPGAGGLPGIGEAASSYRKLVNAAVKDLPEGETYVAPRWNGEAVEAVEASAPAAPAAPVPEAPAGLESARAVPPEPAAAPNLPDPDDARAVADGAPGLAREVSPEQMQAANDAAAAINASAARAQAPPTAGNLAMKLDPAEQAPPPRGPEEPPGAPSPYDPPDLTEPILRGVVHLDTVTAVGEAMQDAGIAWNQKRFPVLSDQIAAMVHDGTLPLQTLVARLEAHDLKLVQFMDELWRPAVTDAAKRLNALSQLSKDLARLAREQGASKGVVDAVDEAFAEIGGQLDSMALARGWWRRLENIRRGLLVTQLSTMMRNVETQVARVGVGAITESLDYAMQRALKGAGVAVQVTTHPLDGMHVLATSIRSLTTFGKGERARKVRGLSETLLGKEEGGRGGKFVDGLFDQRFHDRLFNVFASDVSRLTQDGGVVLKGADRVFRGLEVAADKLNVLNRGQEFIFRNAVLVTRLDSELAAKGAVDLATTITQHNRLVKEMEGRDPGWKTNQELLQAFQADSRNLYSKVDGKMLDRAIDSALEMTFAESPKFGTVGYEIVRAVNKIPPLTLILPFPRFMWNSTKFLWQYNPTGFLNLLSSDERARISRGDTKAISKAAVGTAMLFAAYQVRSSDDAGERWYEIKVGGRNVDIRPFNPFAAHFFVADVLLRWKEKRLYQLTSGDVLTGLLSTNLRAGTGLALLDNFVKQATSLGSADEVVKALGRMGGEYLSGFMTPLQPLADAYAQFAATYDPSVQIVRDRRQSPFLAPVKSRIPGGTQDLPELELPTRAGPARNEFPLVKQLTGLLISDPKNPLESELQRLSFAPNEIFRGTRSAEYDALTKHYMGIFAEELGTPLVQSAEYQNLSDPEKGLLLAEVLGTARKSARAMAKAERPELFIELKRKSPRQRIFEDALEEEAEDEMSPPPPAEPADLTTTSLPRSPFDEED